MKPLSLFVAVLFTGVFITNSLAAPNVTRESGGSIKTALGYGVILNKDSTLTREWITVHDDAIPAEIPGTVGVKTSFKSGERYSNGSYQYNMEYSIKTKEALSAFEVRVLTFDIWGNHVRNLSATDITDMEAGEMRKFDGSWNLYSEHEASEYYASIAYIAQVRTKTGRVIKTNPQIVLEQARMFSKKFSEGDLEPKPEKK